MHTDGNLSAESVFICVHLWFSDQSAEIVNADRIAGSLPPLRPIRDPQSALRNRH